MSSIQQLIQLPKLQQQFVSLFDEINKGNSYSYWAQMQEFTNPRWLNLRIADLEKTKSNLKTSNISQPI
jgi:hypothetical protein